MTEDLSTHVACKANGRSQLAPGYGSCDGRNLTVAGPLPKPPRPVYYMLRPFNQLVSLQNDHVRQGISVPACCHQLRICFEVSLAHRQNPGWLAGWVRCRESWKNITISEVIIAQIC